MTSISKSLGLAMAACAITLAGCATQPGPPRHASAPASSARTAPPAGRGLAVQASAFESFMRHARAIDAGFSDPSDVAQALQTGAGHEPGELEAGMIAYAATSIYLFKELPSLASALSSLASSAHDKRAIRAR